MWIGKMAIIRTVGVLALLSLTIIACEFTDNLSVPEVPEKPALVATYTPTRASTQPTQTLSPDVAAVTLAVETTPLPTVSELAFDKWSLWSGVTQLRGANIYQRRVFPEIDGLEFIGPGPFGPPYTQEDFNRLAEMGANYVNLSIAGVYTVEPPYEIDQQAVENLDRLLEMAVQANLFAVVSFRTGPGRSEFSIIGVGDWAPQSYVIETVWEQPAAQAAWAAMWRYTAERYQGNPVVVGYDLMCEPNSNGILDIWDAGEFQERYGGTGYDWNTWYPRIVEAIRSVDGDTPILVSGMSFGDLEWLPYLKRVEDERVIYTFHQYSPHEYTHQEIGMGYSYPGKFDTNYDGQVDAFDVSWLENYLSFGSRWAAENSARLGVNEFGVVRWAPGADEFLRAEMNFFEKYGWNHAIWMWYPAWAPLAEGDNSFNFRLGPDPENLTDLTSADILNVLQDFWARNTVRPDLLGD